MHNNHLQQQMHRSQQHHRQQAHNNLLQQMHRSHNHLQEMQRAQQQQMHRSQQEAWKRQTEQARRRRARAARNPALGVQQVSDVQAGWTAPRGGRLVRGPASSLVGLFRSVMKLAVLVVVVGLVLLVLKPTGPEWLVHVVHALDRLVHTFRSVVP